MFARQAAHQASCSGSVPVLAYEAVALRRAASALMWLQLAAREASVPPPLPPPLPPPAALPPSSSPPSRLLGDAGSGATAFGALPLSAPASTATASGAGVDGGAG